jgi:hypothetical protein
MVVVSVSRAYFTNGYFVGGYLTLFPYPFSNYMSRSQLMVCGLSAC